jgi:hypothetical protein
MASESQQPEPIDWAGLHTGKYPQGKQPADDELREKLLQVLKRADTNKVCNVWGMADKIMADITAYADRRADKRVEEARLHSAWLALNDLRNDEQDILDHLGKHNYVVTLDNVKKRATKYKPYTDVPGDKYGTSSQQLEDAKRIHAPVIATMDAMGYGLMKDGDTFYKVGNEIQPFTRQNFNMTQAYAIHSFVRATHHPKGGSNAK